MRRNYTRYPVCYIRARSGSAQYSCVQGRRYAATVNSRVTHLYSISRAVSRCIRWKSECSTQHCGSVYQSKLGYNHLA